MRSSLTFLFALLFAVLPMRPVWAVEFEDPIPGPTLHVASEIVVRDISISLTRKAVTSSFDLENDSPYPLDKRFVLTASPQRWFSPFFRDDAGFDDLAVSVNDKPAALQKVYSAWSDGRNITSELAKAGLPAYFDSAESYSDAHADKVGLSLEHPLFKKGYIQPCDRQQEKDIWCPRWKVYQWFTFAHAFSAHGTANISWSYAPRVGYIYTSQHDTRLWDLGGNAGELEAVLPVTGDNPYYLLVWQTVRLDSIPSPEPAKRVTLSIDWRNAATEYYVVIIAGDKRAAGKDSISLTIESTPLSGEATFYIVRRLGQPPRGDNAHF